ncbi:hypothetical protein [Polluticoccus soli]|uniref:hypothetical protein n=1 Tax=Polluticoccus soli TaxID=3034150 RepID=UPI0023E0EB42|nr:hypothetical protein [Flavipsychrobacter sp. JY13-12]
MRLRTFCLLLILLGLTLDTSAQRRKKKAAPKRTTQTKAKTKAKTKGHTTTLQRSSAKDTLLKGATIEILQSYKPEVKNTPKPEFATNLPPVDTTTPRMDYDVPQQSLSYTYSSTPLRPLALGNDSVENSFANYVKLGAGNLSTLYLDAGIGSFNSYNYETNLNVHHISQAGNIEFQKSSLSSIDADGTLHRDGHALHASLDALRNRFYHYGYNHDVYTYEKEAVAKTYYGVRLGADIKNEDEGLYDLNYHPSISMSAYGVPSNAVFGASERSFDLAVPVSYDVDSTLSLLMGVNLGIASFNDAFVKQTNNYFQLTPGVRFTKGNISGHAGLYPTVGKGGIFYILPDIEGRFGIGQSQYAFTAGWKSQLRQNTFEQLSTINPYMWDSYTVKQTRSDEIFGGIEGNVGNHISFGGRLSWWKHHNMPLFINDTAFDEKRFLVVYDRVTAIALQANVRYQIANTFSVGLSGTWTGYSTRTFHKAWHLPGVQLKGDLMVKPLPKLAVTGYVMIMDEIYALAKGDQSEKLSTIADIGAGAEYSFIPRLSAFIQANNILNNKYERWRNYQAYGFNIFGGLRLKF